MRYLILFLMTALLLSGAVFALAQNDGTAVSDAVCSPALTSTWTNASDVCIGQPIGYVCNGGAALQAEPVGPVNNALANLGALVEVEVVDSIRTPPLTTDTANSGLAWLRVADPPFTGLMVGEVNLRDVTPPDFPAWQSFVMETPPQTLACGTAPGNVFVVQSHLDPDSGLSRTSNIVVNGASLVFYGTVMLQTHETETLFVNLAGQARVLARGQEQPLLNGQQLSVPYPPGDFSVPAGPPTLARPMDLGQALNLPVGLLDRPMAVPQPGYASTSGPVNLRSEPSTAGPLIVQVPAGQILSVLGRNPAGDWLHVRLDSGLTGWMFAELLQQNLGDIQTAYEATPLPPQRYGELGTTALVVAPAGVNIREAPDVQFHAIVTLPAGTTLNLQARSPYGPWVRVENGGVVGWAALIALETQAVVSALPIDYDVPPPPAPTRVPGSFGNAFPDPRNNN